MKVLSVLVLVAALLVTGYMFFTVKSVENDIDALSDKMITERGVIDSYRQTIVRQQQEMEDRRGQIAAVNTEIISAEDHYYYTTHRGAFLTFDDGPNDNTPKILETLRQNDVRATFFIIGSQVNSSSRESTLRMIANEGHAVGIHCYNHVYADVYASEEAYFEDLYKTRDLIERVTGLAPNIVRFPGGSSTAKTYFDKVDPDLFIKVVKRLFDEGYEIEDWTVDTEDSSSKATVSKMTDAVQKNIAARTKSSNQYKTIVVLMHNKQVSLDALQKIIDLCKKNDFEFDTRG